MVQGPGEANVTETARRDQVAEEPVLVALSQVTWWQFTIAVALSLLGTVVVARLAATIYLQAILRSGQRVRLRDITGRSPMTALRQAS